MRVYRNEPIRSEIQRKRSEAGNLRQSTAHLYTHESESHKNSSQIFLSQK
jgi:hypothetical protein